MWTCLGPLGQLAALQGGEKALEEMAVYLATWFLSHIEILQREHTHAFWLSATSTEKPVLRVLLPGCSQHRATRAVLRLCKHSSTHGLGGGGMSREGQGLSSIHPGPTSARNETSLRFGSDSAVSDFPVKSSQTSAGSSPPIRAEPWQIQKPMRSSLGAAPPA